MSSLFNSLTSSACASDVRAESRRLGAVPSWVVFTALLLIAVWLPVTSHEWLEATGWIHSHEDSGHDAHHEAADGVCRLEHGLLLLKAPTFVEQSSVAMATEELVSALADFSVTQVTVVFHSTAPPELAATWQFSHRTAGLNQGPPALG